MAEMQILSEEIFKTLIQMFTQLDSQAVRFIKAF